MIRRLTPLALAALLASCSGGGGTRPASAVPPTTPTIAPTSGTSSTFIYNAALLSGATKKAAAQLGSVGLELVPKLQNSAGLLTYAAQVSSPTSASYRHFLTPAQIADRFGASASDYANAVAYLKGKGLSVQTWPQRLMIHVSGTQAAMQSALGTTFAWYTKSGQTFLAPATAPVVPAGVPIIGATNAIMFLPTFTTHVKAAGGLSPSLITGYAPQQIAAAFDYTGAYNAGYTGSGITVGIIGTGGISPLDVPAYKAMFGVGGSSAVTLVAATNADNAGNSASSFTTPPPVTAPCNPGTGYSGSVSPTATCNPEDGEAQLDTEQIASLAYNANVRFYLAYDSADGCGVVGTTCPPGTGIPLQGLGEIDAELQTAIADNQSDVLSLSFGGAEAAQVGFEINAAGYGLEPLEFAALVSEGTAVFASSGDSGAQACLSWSAAPNPDAECVSYPSTDPSVVSVGGVNTPLNAAGQFVGPLTGWGDATSLGDGGSGGGVSAYFTAPAFQQGAAGITGTMRNVPDIALEADDLTGVAVIVDAGPSLGGQQILPVGGTSVAAPESAAMWALVLQACKQTASCASATGTPAYRLGNPNPFFYKIYGNATSYASTFTDVVFGSNGQTPTCAYTGATPCPTYDSGYNAGVGYDLVTGIGVPYARALIHAVVGV
jgi:kumamolisin